MSFHSIAKTPTRQLASGVFEIWKKRGETLAVLLRRFRKEENIAHDVPMTYAGRLDPMAEGIVILLVGKARFEKEKYMALKKEYVFEVFLGVSTDTYDVLGLIDAVQLPVLSVSKEAIKETIEKALEKIKHTRLPYPSYSSCTVSGKPLFAYTRSGTPVTPPLQKHLPKELSVVGIKQVSIGVLVESIKKDVSRVEGDFRQEAIIKKWDELEERYKDRFVYLITCTALVPSGVYIRSIAHALSRELETEGIAYRIIRTNIEMLD